MPELIGYDNDGNPQFSFSDEDKLKGIRVRPHNALLDPAPVVPAALPVDVTGVGSVPNDTTGFVAADKLFGLNGQERFQTWPERMVRSGVSLAHDVVTGELPVTDASGATNDELVRRAQDMAGLAGGATLGINPAEMTVASGMTKMAKNGLKLTPVEGNPFVTDVFHGTPNPGFIKFNPPNSAEFMIDRALGVHVSKDPAISNTFAKESGGVYPAKIPDDSKFLEVEQPHLPYIKDTSIPKTPSNVLSDQSQIEQLVMKTAFQKDPELLARYLTQARAVPEGEALKLATDMAAGKKVDLPVDGKGWDLDRFLRNFGGRPYNREDSARAVDLFKKDMQDKGYVGLKYINTSPMETAKATDPTSYIVFDPSKHIVSKYTNMLMSDTQKPGMALSALEKPAPVFYSALENAVNNITANKMPADQWLGTLTNAKGVKPEEMEWTGLKDFLAEQKGPVTKDQVQQYLDANKVELKEVNKGEITHPGSNATEEQVQNYLAHRNSSEEPKFSKYQLPGGENYRETLLTLPGKRYWLDGSLITPEDLSTEFGRASADRVGSYGDNVFQSSHWDEPNVLAHVRMNDRTMNEPGYSVINSKSGNKSQVFATREEAEAYQSRLPKSLQTQIVEDQLPKKSLHLEEIQSDWHQLARDKGYAVSADKIEKLRPQFEKIDEKLLNSNDEQLLGHPEVDGMLKMAVDKKIITPDEAKIYKQVSDTAQTGAVPDAPFKKTWHELVLKRMLREAAEKGYDRLSWTPGEAQAARYDLSKEIDRLSYNPKTEKLYAYKGDSAILDGETVPKDKIANYVGKGVAQRLLESKPSSVGNAGVPIHSLEGESLKINPEEARGMNTFYNMMIPKALEKIGKEHGVKVKSTIIDTTRRDAMGRKSGEIKKHPIHYIDIPQSLKDQALRKGFPLFSSGVMLSPIENNPFDNQPKLTPVPGNPFE